jgi:glycosyltransferase involved in cell wall biosynthesis
MAAALVKLAADRQWAEGLGKAARARFLRHYTLDRMADAYIRLFEEVSAGGAGRDLRHGAFR